MISEVAYKICKYNSTNIHMLSANNNYVFPETISLFAYMHFRFT